MVTVSRYQYLGLSNIVLQHVKIKVTKVVAVINPDLILNAIVLEKHDCRNSDMVINLCDPYLHSLVFFFVKLLGLSIN